MDISWSESAAKPLGHEPDASPVETGAPQSMLLVEVGDAKGWMIENEHDEFELMPELECASSAAAPQNLPACSLAQRDSIFNNVFHHEGKLFFRHDPDANLPAMSRPSMRVQVTSLVGSPCVQLVMWSPTDHSEYWYSPGMRELRLGGNVERLGETTKRQTWFSYAIVLGKGDAVCISELAVDGKSLLRGEVLTLSHDGIVDDGSDDGWALL